MTWLLDTCMDEFGANLIYTDHGLDPHYGLDRAIKDAGGGDVAYFERGGERWRAVLYYQESGLEPRDHPDYRLETVREHRINVTAVDDPAGKRRANFHIAPRWPEREGWPDILGVNVSAKGAKLDFDDYPELLERAADALGINPDYFAREHEYSNIYEAEVYARVDDSKTRRMFGVGSVMQRTFELAGQTGKYRKLVEDDRSEPGSMHMCEFRPKTAGALVSGHQYGKRVKHYLLQNPPSDPSDPLHHPKVCMLFKKSLNSGAVAWSDRAELRRELDEMLLNFLSWSGLPTRPDGETYVADGYFEPTDSPRPTVSIVEDPTPEIKREQGALVVKALAGLGTGNPDLTESDTDALRVMADGGRPMPVDSLAEAIGKVPRTVRNIVQRLSEILQLDRGVVSFESDYMADQARHGLRSAAEAFDRDGGVSGEGSAWSKFLAEYGPRVGELFPRTDAGNITLDFGEVPRGVDMAAVLREGLRAWIRSGREKRKYTFGEASWRQNGESDSGRIRQLVELDSLAGPKSELKSLR